MRADAGYQPTDKGMEDLLPKFGREVCDHLRRVTIEMYEANGSGRYVVFKPWLKDEDKEATPAEFVTAMNKR